MKKTTYLSLSIFFMFILWIFLLVDFCKAQIPAFPGAEGFGATTPGGRRGKVIEVTNLKDSGTGSFREAVQYTSDPRIVVFRVGGTIKLKERIRILEPYITIAGQTAPGDGICLKGYIRVYTHDVIIRGLRVRPGDVDNTEEGNGIVVANSSDVPYNIIVDHCSVSWAWDENMSTWYPCENITYQWCIISEGLNNSVHPKGIGHSAGSLIGDHTKQISIHHCLYAHNSYRNPLAKGNTEGEFINNVVYDWGGTTTRAGGGYAGSEFGDAENSGSSFWNLINNYYKAGLYSDTNRIIYFRSSTDKGTRVYVKGNIGPNRPTDSGDEWDIVNGSDKFQSQDYTVTPSEIATQSAIVAKNIVLQSAGAIVPHRDSVDLRIVNDVINCTGNIIDSQNDVGGWPELASGIPPQDLDSDGIPDSFELDNTNPPSETALNSNSTTPSGYTWIEEYINGLIQFYDTTSVNESEQSNRIPLNYLLCNYPNPFNPSTKIQFAITSFSMVSLNICDISGRLIRILFNEFFSPNTYNIIWDGRDNDGNTVSAGVYLYSLQTDDNRLVRKMILIK